MPDATFLKITGAKLENDSQKESATHDSLQDL